MYGKMPNGHVLKGVFAGVTQEGQEFMVVTGQNGFFPVGFPVSFMMGVMKPDRYPNGKPSAPAVKPSANVDEQVAVQVLDATVPAFVPQATVVERQAPRVELCETAFPKLPIPVRTFQRQAASGEVRQAPMVERQAPVVRRPVPNAVALEAAAIDCVVRQLQLQAGVVGLRHRIVHTTHAQFEVRASCPAFEIVDVDGNLSRASIPLTLGKRISDVREKLLQELDYVPSGTYVRLSWEFERADGKLLDKTGVVKAFFRW